MLTNMFLGSPPATRTGSSTSRRRVTGNLFFVPTVDFLDDPPTPAPAAEPEPEPKDVDAPAASEEPPGTGSLAIGSLREMN